MFKCSSISRPSQIVVYNSTTGYNNPITIGQLRAYSIDAVIQYPPKEMMMCPSGECTNKDWYFRVNVMLTHYLPAYFLDLFSRLTGKRGNMVRDAQAVLYYSFKGSRFFF